MSELTGKVALVTGGSRGVGLAVARDLVRRGMKVAITARGRERLDDSRAKLEAEGGDVIAVAGDVGDPGDARRMVDTTVDRFGRLDVVVANAGVSMRGEFADLATDVCTRVIQTNLLGCIYVAKAAANHLIESRGSLVFISSIVGLFGVPGASIYCASKGALTGLCESIRLELTPRGVHVGIVYLGFTEHDPEKRVLAADGTPVLPDRPAHHTQAEAAKRIVRAIVKRKRRLVMTPVGKLGWAVYRLSPGLVERAILLAQSGRWGVFKRFS